MGSRKHAQAELIYELGALLGPIQTVIKNPSGFDDEEKERVRARYCAECDQWRSAVEDFCDSEPHHRYERQSNACSSWLSVITDAVKFDDKWWTARSKEIAEKTNLLIETILSVPVTIDSTIHKAETPFSTYAFVKDLCSTANKKIVWMDRYFDQTIFYRYFTDTPSTATITLVTYPRAKCTSKKDEARYDAFLDLSRLFALERGSNGYRLATDEHFHDRWLRCDDKLFSLGGSIKDIGNGNTFTISKLESNIENCKEFDDPPKRGTEVFGPTQIVDL